MQMVFNEKNQWLIPMLLLTALLGFLTAYSHNALIGIIGVGVFALVVALATNEDYIKIALPPYLLLLLFQDTIAENLFPISAELGSLVNFLDEALIIVGISALFVNFIQGKKIRGMLVFATLITILIFGFISGFLNNVPWNISIQGAFLMVKGLLFLFIFMNIDFNEKDITKYIKWIKWAAVIVLLFAIVDMVFTESYRSLLNITYFDHQPRGGIESLVSLFIHPGIFGWFMVFIGIYTLAAFHVTKKKAYLGYSVLFLVFALLSFRFKAMLAVLVILGIIYLLKGYKKIFTYFIPITLVALIAFLFAGNHIIELTTTTINSYLTIDMYQSARKALYVVGGQIGVANFPFGEGFGRYGGFISQEYYSPVYYEYGISRVWGLSPEFSVFMMDTYWPNVLGEVGFVGMGVLLGLFVYIAIQLFRNYKKVQNISAKIFILFAGLIMIHALVESLGEPIFNSAPQNVFIFAVIGIAFSLSANMKNTQKNIA